MPFLISQAIEVRPAKAEILPDERKRLTRFVSWKQNSELPLQLTYNYGDADVFTSPPTGWEGLRLIDAQSDYSLSNNGAGNDPIIRLTYEQISASGLTQVGGTETTVLEDGRVSKTLTYIQFSSVIYTPTAAGTAGEGGFLLNEVANDNGSVRTIRRTYVESGLISQDDREQNNGALLIRTVVSAIDVPSTPAGYTLIDTNVRGPDGYEVYTYTFVQGEGVVSTDIRARQDGLRQVTIVSFGTRVAPDGIVIDDSEREADGYIVYSVTAIQSADGAADPTTAEVEFERYVPFTYPGRAKTFTETANGRTFLDVFRSPPVTTDVKATITVSYQTSDLIGTVSNYWNPSEWATLRASWVGLNDMPQNQVTALPGYRSTSSSAVEATASTIGDGSSLSCMGNMVFGGTTARVVCTGGPADPGGTTKTLDVTLEPAFISTAGTVYYRRTEVVAAIPAQASLPV